MKIKIKRNKEFSNLNIVVPLFIYWIIVVIWQNVNKNYLPRSSIDIIIKCFSLTILAYTFLKRDINIKKKNLFIWLIFSLYFIIMMFLSTKKLSINILVYYFFPILLSFLTLVCHSESQINLESYFIFLKMYIIFVIYMVLYSLVNQTHHFINALSVQNAYGNELTSFFRSSHEYGMNLVFGIIALFICYKFDEKKKSYILLMILFIINLILTFSRTSYITLLIFFFTYILFTKKKSVKIIASIIALISSLFISLNSTVNNFIFKIMLKSNNDAGRFEMWEYAINDFNNYKVVNQIFGKGYEKISNNYLQYYGQDNLHNAFIQVLVMYGLVGIIFFLGILVYGIKSAIRIININREMSAVFIALIFSSISIMFTNTTCIMTSSLNSYMITIFTIIIPRYVSNYIYTRGLIK